MFIPARGAGQPKGFIAPSTSGAGAARRRRRTRSISGRQPTRSPTICGGPVQESMAGANVFWLFDALAEDVAEDQLGDVVVRVPLEIDPALCVAEHAPRRAQKVDKDRVEPHPARGHEAGAEPALPERRRVCREFIIVDDVEGDEQEAACAGHEEEVRR